jgi:hypothetical protein
VTERLAERAVVVYPLRQRTKAESLRCEHLAIPRQTGTSERVLPLSHRRRSPWDEEPHTVHTIGRHVVEGSTPLRAAEATGPVAGDRRDEAIAAVVAAQAPVDAVDSVGAALRAQIAACDTKIARYKATLDAGADPAVVAGWITTTQAERAAALAQLRPAEDRASRRLSRTEIADLIDRLGDLVATLRQADHMTKPRCTGTSAST